MDKNWKKLSLSSGYLLNNLDNPWNDPYIGSPKTHKNKWEITNFTKVVIECFDSDEKVSKAETDLLIELDWENDP